MRALVIADAESPAYWDYLDKEKFKKEIDIVISCGDLKPEYLSFLATFCKGPVLYVHGNHDVKYDTKPPEGCECIEDTIYEYEGVRFLGLGGSMNYNGSKYQYTEGQMSRRIKKLWFSLWKKKGFDILVAHSPARGLGDGDDLPHRGFECFRDLLDKYEPSYFFHGHMHQNYNYKLKAVTEYNKTKIVNGYEKQVVEIEIQR